MEQGVSLSKTRHGKRSVRHKCNHVWCSGSVVQIVWVSVDKARIPALQCNIAIA